MLIGAIFIAWIAGILIGSTFSYNKGFEAGKSWGFQLSGQLLNDQTVIDRVRAVM